MVNDESMLPRSISDGNAWKRAGGMDDDDDVSVQRAMVNSRQSATIASMLQT